MAGNRLWAFAFAFLLVSTGQAQALPAHLVKDEPEIIATFHCRQIYADATERLLTADMLNQLAGDGNLAELMAQEELDAVRREFGMAPDFGFLLEGRWQALTRDERQRFNHLFAAALRTTYGLPPGDILVDKCHSKLLVPVESGQPQRPLPDLRYARSALTIQKPDGNLSFIPLLYLFHKGGGGMWQVEDIQLGGQSLKAHLARVLPDALGRGGLVGVLNDLRAIADGEREAGGYFPQ